MAPVPLAGVATKSEKDKSKKSVKSTKSSSASVSASKKSQAPPKRDVRPLEMQPVELDWKQHGGLQEIKLQNPGNDRVAFKVRGGGGERGEMRR